MNSSSLLSSADDSSQPSALAHPTLVVVGKESVGKSQWITSLTGAPASVGNFRGTTVSCETYDDGRRVFVDTPGIVRQSDAETTRLALSALSTSDYVVLVAQATHLDDDLTDLLPLVADKRGLVVVTFWDKVDSVAESLLAQLSERSGIAFLPVDARSLTEQDRKRAEAALGDLRQLPAAAPFRFGRRIEPKSGLFESRFGALIAASLLFVPAVVAVEAANRFAGWADPMVRELLKPAIDGVAGRSAAESFGRALLIGDYGLLTMGPLLPVWAVPTVLLFAVFFSLYKASGLVDRLNSALHPWVRPFGLAGRDVVRIVMGFGCNVPAVVSTRSCSSCSRGACISAIAFGSACSYQLPATAAVFAAAGYPGLTLPFLGYLLLTTAAYLRLISSREARSPLNLLVIERRTFLQVPSLSALWREMRSTLVQFFGRALPIFVVITVAASTAAYFGLVDAIANLLAPLMKLFNLPGEAALPTVVASIRKDGLLLFLDGEGLRVPLTRGQLLTGAYLAGVLFPCLVTVLTISREQSTKFAWKLVVRQATAAVLFAALLGWGAWSLGL
jgi:ferrous iron transport protein B